MCLEQVVVGSVLCSVDVSYLVSLFFIYILFLCSDVQKLTADRFGFNIFF